MEKLRQQDREIEDLKIRKIKNWNGNLKNRKEIQKVVKLRNQEIEEKSKNQKLKVKTRKNGKLGIRKI